MQNTLHNTKLYRLPPSVSSSEKVQFNCIKILKNIREFVMKFNFASLRHAGIGISNVEFSAMMGKMRA